MITYLIRRLLLIIPTLIGATALVFLVIQLSPGSVTATLLADDANMRPAERQAREAYLKARYGLGEPVHIQYLMWLNKVSPLGLASGEDGKLGRFGFKVPDLGNSFSRGRPVGELIGEALPTTLLMQVISLPLAYLIAISAGIYAARYRAGVFDTLSGMLFLALYSLPVIWVAVMLVGFLANVQYVKLFPSEGVSSLASMDMPFLPTFTPDGWVRGYLLDRVWHLILPIVCLTYGNFAFLSKLTRGAVLETIQADFVRTARAKGVSETAVLFRHAFRNSLIPLITVAAGLLPALIGGAVVVETVFGIQGMGRLFVDAVRQKDQEMLLSLITIVTLLSVLGTLLADIANVLADPRVSYE
jgi:peptide/nickel transport system permease protein